MDPGRRQLVGAVIKLLEDDGKTNLSEILYILEKIWGEKLFAEYVSEIVDIWKQRQQLKTLKIDSHVRPCAAAVYHPECRQFTRAAYRTHSGCGNYIRRQSLERWDIPGRDVGHTIQITCTKDGDTDSSQFSCVILSEDIAEEIGMIKFDILFGVGCAPDDIVSATTDAQVPQTAVQQSEQPQVDVGKFWTVALIGLCLVLTCMRRARN